jgi:hypothetical protein
MDHAHCAWAKHALLHSCRVLTALVVYVELVHALVKLLLALKVQLLPEGGKMSTGEGD